MAKMDPDDRKKYFLKKLEELRHLLRTAIVGMSDGDLVQALHVAAIIRTLVHEGGTKPLLKHIDANYLELPILDRVLEPPKDHGGGVKSITFTCPISAKISSPAGTVGLITELEASAYVPSSLGRWWDGYPCMLLPGLGPYFRRELILGMANKEGGTHVDADIPKRYQMVLDSQFMHFKINDMDLGPLNVSRLVTGKCGVELLDCLDKNFPIPNAEPAKSAS
jgi:hypothetical protein